MSSEDRRPADRGEAAPPRTVAGVCPGPADPDTRLDAVEAPERLIHEVLPHGRQLLDHLPAATAVADASGQIVLWNRMAERLFGWTAEEVAGRLLDNVVRALVERDATGSAAQSSGDTVQTVATFARRDGTTSQAVACTGSLLDDAGVEMGTVHTWMELPADLDESCETDAAEDPTYVAGTPPEALPPTGAIEATRRARSAVQLAQHERRLRERLEFLTRLDAAIFAANDYRKLMRDIALGAVPRLGDWCVVHFMPERGGPVDVEVAHSDPAKIEWARAIQQRFPFQSDAPTGVASVIRSGRIEVIRDIDEAVLEAAIDAAVNGDDREEIRTIVRELSPTSSIIVPLRTKRGVVGALQFVCAESRRRYDNDDVTLAQAVAGRVADALDNAWHTEQHHTIAKTLQGALLPPRLPSVDEMDVAIRYWAAGAATDVGGDFYDLFRLDDRRWAVVIGDVCGTGPDAAAVTAIARHTIRAAATHGVSHAGVLRWVNDALHAGDRNFFCTLVYATLEKDRDGTWSFTSIAGGHPLPLLVRADGGGDTVGTPGTLLGVLPTVTATPTTTELAGGDTIVLYTDGITDVRPPYDLSVESLVGMVRKSASHRGTAEEIAEDLGVEIAGILPIPERNDDLALVVLHLPPDGRE